MRKIYSAIYSKNSVLEVREAGKTKVKNGWKETIGRVILRGATFDHSHKEIVVSLTPTECFALSIGIKHILKTQEATKKRIVVHKPAENKFTEVYVEHWKNENRDGYAVILRVKNGETTQTLINVPTSKIELMAFAEFLRDLNTIARWKEAVKVEQGSTETPTPTETEEEETEEDEISDDDIPF